jgi:hypothetical protein
MYNQLHQRQKFPRQQKKVMSLVNLRDQYASIFDGSHHGDNFIMAIAHSQ